MDPEEEPKEGVRRIEKVIEGLNLRELEAHDRAELLPDRVEIHRRRRWWRRWLRW